MIVGNEAEFAVESHVSRACKEASLRALGFFVIYIREHCYGVRSSDATMLANSFDAVRERIIGRGMHTAVFAESNAASIADAYSDVVFNESHEPEYLGVPTECFRDALYRNHLVWAPDGDEAFDDGSHVLQFDLGDRVRLVAFKRLGQPPQPSEVIDLWLDAERFYAVLRQWVEAFDTEWTSMTKVADEQA